MASQTVSVHSALGMGLAKQFRLSYHLRRSRRFRKCLGGFDHRCRLDRCKALSLRFLASL